MESKHISSSNRSRALAIALGLILLVPGIAAAADLVSYVPEKAVVVGMVRVQDLRTSPLTGKLFDHTDQISTDGEAREFLAEAGLEPSRDIDTVLMAVTPRTDDPKEGEVLLVVEGRFDASRLAASLTKRGALPQAASGRTYYLLPDDQKDESDSNEQNAAVAFVSNSLVFAGTEPAVVDALAAYAGSGTSFRAASNLGHEMGRVDSKSTAWLLVDVQRAARLTNSPQTNLGDEKGNVAAAALKHVSTLIIWGRDAGDSIKFGGTALTVDAETRDLLEDTLRGITAAWRLAMQDKAPEWIPVIRGFEIDKSSDGVTLTGSIPAELLQKQASKIAVNQD